MLLTNRGSVDQTITTKMAGTVTEMPANSENPAIIKLAQLVDE